MKKLLTTKQTCEILGLSRTTLYKLVREGRLRGQFYCKRWMFREQDIEAFLSNTAVGD
jgi:excisionase family DNA binding protein